VSDESYTPKTFADFLGAFEGGVNSGVQPLLLAKNQLAFGMNCTVRGTFVTDRPPVSKKTLIYDTLASQTLVENGLFQGAGYYRPDFGTESLIAQISGHLFKFTETGTSWTVSDISVPGDPNNATTSQVWMWQAEKWMIVQDGTGKLPIFYDGVASRRSYGPSVVLGVVNATSLVKPPTIGSSLTVTLNTAWTGPFNVPVIFNKAFYQTVSSLVGNVILTNVSALAAALVPSGSQITVNPNYIGYTGLAAATVSVPSGGTFCAIPSFCKQCYTFSVTLSMQSIGGVAVGNQVLLQTTNNGTQTYTVDAVNAVLKTINISRLDCSVVSPVSVYMVPPPHMADVIAANTLVQFASNMGPNVSLGTTTADFVNPPLTGTVNVSLNTPYSGPANQLCFIGTEQYIINAAPVSGGMTLILINLSDATSTNYAFPLDILSVPELPAGRMGVYGMGRNWMSLIDGISFIGGDIVGGAAGTPAHNYRDSVLKTTENTFLVTGSFRLPGSGDIINSMVFTANLDLSLGQGPLQVGTAVSMFSCNAPVDRTTWQALTNPILTESLIGLGPLNQNSTILVNSDTFFRSLDGICSLILARRDFTEWGNTPISREMSRVLSRDNKSLLPYGSAVMFDNRFLTTCAPNVSAQGVFHIGMVAMNLDPLSTLRGKAPAVYDGLWTGVNTFQVVSGTVNGSRRSFSFSYNLTTNKIELYEFLASGGTDHLDNGVTPIVWLFETPITFGADVKSASTLIRLRDGEVFIRDLTPGQTVEIEVQYRPDFYPCWTTWKKFKVCVDAASTQPGYYVQIGLGEPSPDDCEPGNNRPLRVGNVFQYRIQITGHCEFMGMKVNAIAEPQPDWSTPICSDEIVCQKFTGTVPDDFRVYSLQGLPALPLPTIINPPPQSFGNDFGNDAVFYSYPCILPDLLTYTGTLPGWITIDTINSRLVGATGTYRADSKTEATATAQAALDAFATAAIANGHLICQNPQPPPPASCSPGADTNQYAISPYTDGDVLNPYGDSPAGGEVVFDGVMKYMDSQGSPCFWNATYVGGPELLIDGARACNVTVRFIGGWHLIFWDETTENIMWYGTKTTGTTPAGVYTRDLNYGIDPLPLSLTVVSIGGTVIDQPFKFCGIT
jgi:hypothetical protein